MLPSCLLSKTPVLFCMSKYKHKVCFKVNLLFSQTDEQSLIRINHTVISHSVIGFASTSRVSDESNKQ